MQKVGV